MKKTWVAFVGLSLSLGLLPFWSCQKKEFSSLEKHPLLGAWIADDNTIFHFRKDGTFHGLDWRQNEIWGNWVVLSETRIGFHSLLHDRSYRPQYAIIRNGESNKMDYIVTNGTHFISATRISAGDAKFWLEKIVEPKVHKPIISSASQDVSEIFPPH